ncbi:unnamed protein product [marine sediment metagenome]|uniref:Uncharacterized protein n=1 Tax=marine sediment metagenome TaxID=412755 RepID=X1AEN1_9ZZZZ
MIQAITITGDILMEFLDDTDRNYMQDAIEELFPELCIICGCYTISGMMAGLSGAPPSSRIPKGGC